MGTPIVKYLSEYTAPRIVQGANGIPPKPWADILYDYFLYNYGATIPPKDKFDAQNEPYNEKSATHVYIMRTGATGEYQRGHGVTDWEETYTFYIYVRRKGFGDLFPDLENIASEIKRIFLEEYESYGIAGIRQFDTLKEGEMALPTGTSSAEQKIWMLPISINMYYRIQVLFAAPTVSSSVYNGARYYAGSIRKTYDTI